MGYLFAMRDRLFKSENFSTDKYAAAHDLQMPRQWFGRENQDLLLCLSFRVLIASSCAKTKNVIFWPQYKMSNYRYDGFFAINPVAVDYFLCDQGVRTRGVSPLVMVEIYFWENNFPEEKWAEMKFSGNLLPTCCKQIICIREVIRRILMKFKPYRMQHT